ncbi:MAG: CRTAC1 family protein [Acidobacteriaceae bacterium]
MMASFTRRSLLAAIAAWAMRPRLLLQAERTPSPHGTAPRAGAAPADSGSPSTAKGWFTDVAGKSSFTYRTNNDYTGRKYFPQPMCGGVAAIDYNNDGFMDLFFTNGAKLPELVKTTPEYYNCLLRNKGDGTFEDVTAKAGLSGASLGFCFGVAAADYDNDGWDDLFICNAGTNTLYHNNGDGTFSDVTVGSGLEHKPENMLSVGAAWFDYDNDGLLDLIVTNYTVWTPETDKQCFMSEKLEEYCSPVVYKSVESRLYHNLGHGRFEDVTEKSGIGKALGKGMGISIADFNGDGLMDIFVANDTEPNFLFINQGDGTFKERGLELGVAYNEQGSQVSGMGSDAKDFNNDGWVDIVYNDLSGQVFGLQRNEGGKSFTDITWPSRLGPLSRNLSGWSIGFIDYNNDGWKDIFSANGDVDNLSASSKQRDTMFENIDGKSLVDVTAKMGADFNGAGYHRGSVFVDLNNDGWMDLVVTSLGEKPRILMNQGLVRSHWVTFDLRGHKSNRNGIGARIQVVTGSGRNLYNHVTTSVGFMSSSDRRVHFGLGEETKISHIEIRWPSGIVQRLENPAADRIIRIEEPEE